MIDDYLYIVFFKQKWKEVTKVLKDTGYDFSKVKIKKGKETQ